MQVRVNAASGIMGGEELNQRIIAEVEDSLRRFEDRITRVEVYLSDQNSAAKSGSNDKRCVMEARLAGLDPISVTEDSETIEQAYTMAAETLQRTLKRTLGKRDNPRRRTSFGGDQTI